MSDQIQLSTEEILNKLRNRQQELLEESNVKNEELVWIEEFLNQSNLSDPLEYNNIDKKKLLLAYMKAKANNLDVQKAEDLIKLIIPILEQSTPGNSKLFVTLLLTMASKEWYEELKDIIKDENEIRRGYSINKMFEEYIETEEEMDALDIIVTYHGGSILKYIEEISKNLNSWEYGISIIIAMKEIADRQEELEQEYNSRFSALSLSKEKELAARRKIIEREFCIECIESELKKITSYKKRLESEEKRKQRRLEQDIKKVANASSKLEKSSNEIISHYLSYISGIQDTESCILLLQLIYNHNQKYYQQLEAQCNRYKANSILNYQTLCDKHNIDGNISIEELRDRYAYETLEAVIDSLVNLGITSGKTLAEILKTSNPMYLNEVGKLLEKGYINPKTLVSTPSLLDPKNKLVETVYNNLKILEEQQIPREYCEGKEQLLLVSSEALQKNIPVLKSTDYINSLYTTTDLSFLESDELEDAINLCLQLGLETVLEEDLDILNYSVSRLKRLVIASDLDLPIETLPEVKRILKDPYFIISDEKIDRYIALKEAQENPEEIKLLPLSETKRTYRLGNIIFPKNKIDFPRDMIENNPQLLFSNRKVTNREYQYIKSQGSNKV